MRIIAGEFKGRRIPFNNFVNGKPVESLEIEEWERKGVNSSK